MAEETIGRYVIKSELGRGGMATVFHAYDPNFERDVAIKVLPSAFLHDPQLRTRFDREAKMIALLEHPAIVPVYDFGDQDGQPYIVMRYMSGGSLADRIKDKAMPLGETSAIISRLASALDVAHMRGIIHRDIKPGNVLFDQYGNAFLSDFGIARQGQSVSTTLTGEGIIGTPTYMSPEQVQGEKTIDGRSDIYSIGVLVYQMLTGHAPYRSDTPAKVMLMHILEPVPDILTSREDLPHACQTVISKAMAKDPNARYATTAELAAALEKTLPKTPTLELEQAAIEDATLLTDRTVAAAPISRDGGKAAFTPTLNLGTAPSIPRRTSAGAIVEEAIPSAQKKPFPIILLLAGILIIAAIAGGFFLFKNMSGQASQPSDIPAAALQLSATLPIPTNTAPVPTATVAAAVVTDEPTLAPPSETPTEAPSPTPLPPIIGGADKIAYINNGNIWIANLDGSGLTQVTTDGTIKTSLQWTPDGSAVVFISGTCIQMASLESLSVETVTCIKFIDSLKSFNISPDSSKVAITIDNQMYIVPYDLGLLRQATTRGNIAAMAACADFAPYLKNFITQVQWSEDSTIIAAKLIANIGGGLQGDAIQLFHVDSCIPNPRALDNFPAPRFTMKGYDKFPRIPNFSWDGIYLFALHTSIRNDGFGDLYVYNSDLKKGYLEINPIGGACCYRDPQWSPDGQYLLFAFQNRAGGTNSTTQLYYIPYGQVGTGQTFPPLNLPDMENPEEKPQPVLRPAR